MKFSQPITEVIEQRYSCRTYKEMPIGAEARQRLEAYASACQRGPLGTPARFELMAATAEDSQALKGLGTYGFIRGAMGFLVGAVGPGEKDMEDFGHLMEQLVLVATDAGLGTCWLGGTFTKSRFAERLGVGEGESMPAAVSVGYVAEERGLMDRLIRRGAGAHKRLPWDRLFFDGQWGKPLSREEAGAYASPLEMVRLGPSASNKQPWRVVKDGEAWHFYLERTPGYYGGTKRLLGLADLQRVDLGIALCHFELTARALELAGDWVVDEPGVGPAGDLVAYTASWVEG
jgi:nitroreductase